MPVGSRDIYSFIGRCGIKVNTPYWHQKRILADWRGIPYYYPVDSSLVKEMIHCALCLHDSGEMHKAAYCALLSCFENASEKIHVHALIDESVLPNAHWIEELCGQTGNAVTFYRDVAVPRDIVEMFPGGKVGDYTEASLYRMCLHEQLPASVEKVLY